MSGGAMFRNTNDLTRVVQGTKNVERLMLSPNMPNGWQPLPTAQTAMPATVRITGAKDSTDFTYPAVLCFVNLETVPPTWYETDECLVYCADTDIDLATDKRYAARPAYYIPDNGITIHPGYFVFLCDGAEVGIGCGLTTDDDGNIIVDVPALAGEGIAYATDPNTNCNVFVVDTTNFNWSSVNYSTFINSAYNSGAFACGFWNDNGVLKIDFVATAGHGIVGDNDTCEYRADADCHIVVGADGISVDLTTLPGTASVTGLVALGAGCKYLSIDLTVDTTLEIPVDVHVQPGGLVMAGGMLQEHFTRYTYVLFKNAAGVVIDFFLDTTTNLYNQINACLFQECCNGTAPNVVISVNTNTGPAPLTVNFSSTVTGGVGSYTWAWSFPGGTPATSNAEDPGDVEFNMPGNSNCTLLVTDECGRTNSVTVEIVVSDGIVTACCPEVTLPLTLYVHVVVTGGTCTPVDEWVTLTWDGTNSWWYGVYTYEGSPSEVYMYLNCQVYVQYPCAFSETLTVNSCSPYNATLTGGFCGDCSVDLEVVESIPPG